MPNFRIILLIYAFLAILGCGVADISSQNQAIEAENRRVYEVYRAYMKNMNERRQETGIPPQRIKSYEEWQESPGTQ